MSDTPAVVAEIPARTRARRRWFRLAIVSAILLLLFGVPWWTLLSAGTQWPTAVVVAGSIVFAAAFVALPALMRSRHLDWAAATGDALLGAVWVVFVWSVLAQALRLVLFVVGVEDPVRARVVAGAVVAVVLVLLAWGHAEAMRVPRVRHVDVTIPGLGGARRHAGGDDHRYPFRADRPQPVVRGRGAARQRAGRRCRVPCR